MKKIAFLVLVLLSGCASLKVVTSLPESESNKENFTHFNTTNNIAYQAFHDKKNLHIRLKTNERASVLKILRTGLHVYFDVNGKKKKDIYVQYPIGNTGQMAMQELGQGNSQGSQFDLKRMLNRISREAIYGYFGSEEAVYLSLNESHIKTSMRSSKFNELIYDLVIPFEKIAVDSLQLSNLSIGIVSGSFDTPSMGSGMGGKKMGGSGMQPGGGRSGGMGPGGGRPGGMSGNMQNNAMSSPIKIWFKVNLQE